MAGFFESAQDVYKMQTQAIESLADSQEVAADGIMVNAAEEEDDGVLGSLKSFVNDIRASREKRRQESAEEPVIPQTKSKPTISQELIDSFMNETKLRYPDMVDKAPNKPLDFSDAAVEKQEAPKPEYQPNEKIGNARTTDRMGLMSQDTVDEETTTTTDSSTSSNTPSLMEPPAKKVTEAPSITSDIKDEANVTSLQTYLTNSGYNTNGVDGAFGGNTVKAIKRLQVNNGLKVTGKLDDETINILNSGNAKGITTKKVGELTIGTGYRDDYTREKPLISMDFNGYEGKAKFGVEVIVPPAIYEAGKGNPYYDAADKYTKLVKNFLDQNGYGDYHIRGVKPPQKDKDGAYRGATNVMHTEPFFKKDKKAVDIINNNKEAFYNLYIEAFKGVDATLIAPHGSVNESNVLDPGTINNTLGSEKAFGDAAISYLMSNY